MTNQDYQDILISETDALAIAEDFYGLKGEIKKLSGEVDFNYLIRTQDEEGFVLKISRPDTNSLSIDFQIAMMNHLNNADLPFATPKVISDSHHQKGQLEIKDERGRIRLVRVQSYIPGRPIIEVNPQSLALLEKWGAACGQMSKALKSFDHPGAHRQFRWDPSNVLDAKKHIDYLDDTQKTIALYFWNVFESIALPKLDLIRKSVNHNDVHELNLIVNHDALDPEVVGIIDFGDAVYTHTINELAIACAYACMGQNDPLEAACAVVKGYHKVFPIQEEELEVLFSLICNRLLISVVYSARNRVLEPENAYLQVSDQGAWKLLSEFQAIAPQMAHFSFRSATGREAVPNRKAFIDWISTNKTNLSPVVPFPDKGIIHLDLAVGGEELGNNANFATVEAMHKTIFRHMEDHDASLGIGGYLETRPFYTTDAYAVMGNQGPQWRSVHIGLDFWDKASTPVFAPLAGKVHSFQNNAADCDYGPTIILEHKPKPQLTFYTLYGHLSMDSLEGLYIGKPVQQGEEIARIGPAPENGNWPPHLHFQIMLDMLDRKGDFPGVAYPHELKVWKSLCPDPILLFPSLTAVLRSNELPTDEELQNKRKEKLGKGLSISYQRPLHMVRGFGQYLYDTKARRYLDTVNNVAHVGHEHPKVVQAAQKQMGLLNTNTRYLHKNLLEYAEKLLATFPPELCVVHFVNSGSEANELALRMAETYTSSRETIAIEVGYHGNTGRTVDVSSYKFDGKGGKGAPTGTHIVPIPDVYRGLYQSAETAGKQYAAHIEKVLADLKQIGKNPSAFIAESILSCGGQIVLPEGYLKNAYESVRAAGGLCIADEVQVGFGRVGSHFWGFELQGVVPDIVTVGKPIGNGHPMGAVITTREVADSFANGMEFFSTFGGNPVSCAIGMAVLEVIEEENLQQNALDCGEYLKNGLKDLMKDHHIIGDVRGHGLFLGFELVENRETKKPSAKAAKYITNRMREMGVLMSTDGPDYNVIKTKPPMCINLSNMDLILELLAKVLKEDFIVHQINA